MAYITRVSKKVSDEFSDVLELRQDIFYIIKSEEWGALCLSPLPLRICSLHKSPYNAPRVVGGGVAGT